MGRWWTSAGVPVLIAAISLGFAGGPVAGMIACTVILVIGAYVASYTTAKAAVDASNDAIQNAADELTRYKVEFDFAHRAARNEVAHQLAEIRRVFPGVTYNETARVLTDGQGLRLPDGAGATALSRVVRETNG